MHARIEDEQALHPKTHCPTRMHTPKELNRYFLSSITNDSTIGTVTPTPVGPS